MTTQVLVCGESHSVAPFINCPLIDDTMGSAVSVEVAPVRTTSVSVTSTTPSSTSSTAVASSSRKTAPLYVSPTWQAGPVASSSSSSSKKPTSSRTTYGNSNNTTNTYVTGGNDVNCDCSIPAIQKTVTDESASKGRKFWNCPTGVCGFFQWVEDAPVASGSSVPAKRSYPPVGHSLSQICPILAYQMDVRRVKTRLQISSCACVNATKKASY